MTVILKCLLSVYFLAGSAMGKKIIGGWSQVLSQQPLDELNVNIYGMVTSLSTLTTGGGWSPRNTAAPRFGGQESVKVLWTYGGEHCWPASYPASTSDINDIVQATQSNNWDGVDFDDECNMNTDNVIEAMKRLKAVGKDTTYGFIAGWDYNNPSISWNGQRLNEIVGKLAASGACDRLIHYCYGSAMWSKSDIDNNVRQALQKSIDLGMPKENVYLALTSIGLTDENLNYFLDQIESLDIGGLFIWNYQGLTTAQRNRIKQRLS